MRGKARSGLPDSNCSPRTTPVSGSETAITCAAIHGRKSAMALNARPLLLVFAVTGLAAAAGITPPQPKLDEAALAGSAHTLGSADAKVFDDAIGLIKQGNHAEALLSLTRLTGSNPKNVAVRATRAYVLLQVGNLLGALDDARVAEKTGPHT